MNPYTLSILCFGFCSLLLGLFVWMKRQDKIGERYFVVALFYAGWAIFIAINMNNDIPSDLGLLMCRIGSAFAVFIPPAWYHFVVVFTDNLKERQKFVKVLYALAFFIVCFTFSPWFISGTISRVGFKNYPIPGPIHYLFTGMFFTIVPLAFFELYKKSKTLKGYEKQQIDGLFLSSLVGYLGGGAAFLPIYAIPFPQYTLFLLPIYPFALAYFMIRQKLFDVEEFAQAAHKDKLTAIGVLAASINHEVKNPLFIIKGLAESCLERQKEGIFPSEEKALESANDAMKRSMEQADRAMDIIKRLSLFAKAGIDSEIKFEPVKVSVVIEDILPLVRYELAANDIVLTRDLPTDFPEVHADRRYLEEILFNLIVNAIQAIKGTGEPGEIKITASRPGLEKHFKTGSLEGHEHRVLIRVEDNGPGIPEDKLKDVFRPFYTTKQEGTGLGLYITKQLVEKIRGRIDVRSEVGQGTLFSVVLPAG